MTARDSQQRMTVWRLAKSHHTPRRGCCRNIDEVPGTAHHYDTRLWTEEALFLSSCPSHAVTSVRTDIVWSWSTRTLVILVVRTHACTHTPLRAHTLECPHPLQLCPNGTVTRPLCPAMALTKLCFNRSTARFPLYHLICGIGVSSRCAIHIDTVIYVYMRY